MCGLSERHDKREVVEKLKPTGMVERGLQEIPLDAIVGSVGRYEDFTRSFLPKRDSDAERWVRIRTAVNEMSGMRPIDVYQVGEAYFVKDGNHRVSVARQLGTPTISAHVTEVKTRVPLTVADDPSEVICKARYVEFLEQTNLDKLCPGADLQMTFCGQYRVLLDQIEARRRQLEQAESKPVPNTEAARRWYEEVYLPLAELIREQGLLRVFPERTETDLYVLLTEHLVALEEALGWEVEAETAATDLADRQGQRRRMMARMRERLLETVVPGGLESGPEPGQWRRARLALRRSERLFADVLMGVRGALSDWQVLEMALAIAQRENGRVHGLHVVEHEGQVDGPLPRRVQRVFEQRCRLAGVPGELTVEAGGAAQTILKRAPWADLVVVNLDQPPRGRPLARLSSGVYQLIQRCPRPILTVPGARFSLERALLAYDGSAKADEALFVATYMATRWQMALTVVTVETEYTTAAALAAAQAYLEQYGVTAEYVLRQRPIADALLAMAAASNTDILVMGGFGFRPLLHLVLGSTVDQMLQAFPRPILICR